MTIDRVLDDSALVHAYKAGRRIDLTHPLVEGMPVWPGHPHFCHDLLDSYERGGASRYHKLELGEHTGTHLDAPLHFVAPPKGWAIDKVPVEQFISRMVVQSYVPYAGGEAVSEAMIREYEATARTPIRPGDAVFFHFGWDRKWTEDVEGFFASWPGLDEGAAAYLVGKGVKLVGCDCLSIDPSNSTTFPAHRVLLGAGVLIGENFNNLGDVGPVGTLAAFPLPIVEGSGSPLRAVAVVEAIPE